MKTCYVCKGLVTNETIDYMAQRSGHYTLIKDLPVERCVQCGEVYLDETASRRIDAALSSDTTADGLIEVPVFHCH